jgi:hypothetical protein
MEFPTSIPEGTDVRGILGWLNQFLMASRSKALKTVQGGTLEETPNGQSLVIPKPSIPAGKAGGTIIYWARITAVTDANNYTCSIFYTRNSSTADETSKAVRVWDIADALTVNDWFPVIPSVVSGKDYECSQQIGLL